MADTLEGIARWRLLQERVQLSVRQTEAALGWLLEQGFIEEAFPESLGSSVFRLNRRRLNEAKRFLAGAEHKKIRKAAPKNKKRRS